jgi:hypothetical protein
MPSPHRRFVRHTFLGSLPACPPHYSDFENVCVTRPSHPIQRVQPSDRNSSLPDSLQSADIPLHRHQKTPQPTSKALTTTLHDSTASDEQGHKEDQSTCIFAFAFQSFQNSIPPPRSHRSRKYQHLGKGVNSQTLQRLQPSSRQHKKPQNFSSNLPFATSRPLKRPQPRTVDARNRDGPSPNNSAERD